MNTATQSIQADQLAKKIDRLQAGEYPTARDAIDAAIAAAKEMK